MAVFNPKITRPHHNAFLEELYSKTIRFGTVGIILLSIWLIAKSDAYDVKILKKYSGVKVSYRDGIITNSNNYYIGSTTNYVFVYNEKSNTTAVYKLADIESIVFAGLNK